jgi:predicted dehydrogenase
VVPSFREVRLGTLRAITARDQSTALATAKALKIPVAHDSYRALLEDPEVDAVYIPLPNDLHHPWTLEALDAGKHVLCEKPMALNTVQAREMSDRARARGLTVREAFMWRHQPRTVDLLRMVREGAIGELRLIRASFSFPMTDDPWRLDPDHGGGALSDVGCYALNAARLFAGSEPREVRSMANPGPTGVDLSITAELRFGDGLLALIDASYEQPLRNAYELAGRLGTIEVPDAFVPPRRPVAFLTAEGRTRRIKFRRANPYAAMLDAFAREVAGSPSTAEDGVLQMVAMDCVRRAARPPPAVP